MNRQDNWRLSRSFLPPELRLSFRNAAILMVAFALILAVATRYTDYSNTGGQNSGPVVHRSLENKRQHIEKTSFVWLVALTNLIRLKPPVTAQIAVISTPFIKVPYGDDLYNRPPPLS